MSRLYELTDQFKSLENAEDLDEQTLADTLEGLTGEFQDKANAVAIVINGMSGRADVIDNEIKRLQAMKKVVQNQENSVRDYLKTNMQTSGISNIKCDLFSITLAKGRAVVVINNEDDLPDEYVTVKTVVQPDKKKILDALKAGETIEGASLGTSDESLRIK